MALFKEMKLGGDNPTTTALVATPMVLPNAAPPLGTNAKNPALNKNSRNRTSATGAGSGADKSVTAPKSKFVGACTKELDSVVIVWQSNKHAMAKQYTAFSQHVNTMAGKIGDARQRRSSSRMPSTLCSSNRN